MIFLRRRDNNNYKDGWRLATSLMTWCWLDVGSLDKTNVGQLLVDIRLMSASFWSQHRPNVVVLFSGTKPLQIYNLLIWRWWYNTPICSRILRRQQEAEWDRGRYHSAPDGNSSEHKYSNATCETLILFWLFFVLNPMLIVYYTLCA